VAKPHPFEIDVARNVDDLGVSRFRWSIYRDGQSRENSPHSYATKREALAEAERVMQKRVAQWRTDQIRLAAPGEPNGAQEVKETGS
jgi:hypothetical protein